MGRSSFKRISEGELKGYVREDLFHLLPPDFFKDPARALQERGGKAIKESRWRWAGILTLTKGGRIFVKRDRTKGWLESLKYLFFPSKGRKEWFNAHQLKERDLSIPNPLGWMEKTHLGFVKESYYLSEAIGSGISIIDSFQSGERVGVHSLAKEVKTFHDSGLFHKDLHGGNFLWNGESFFLTDLHRAKILRSLSFRRRLWNLSQLFHSLRSQWGREDQMRFIEAYFEGKLLDLQKREAVLQEILSLMGRLQKRQWKSRTKRCLKESTEFSVKREKGVTTYYRRDFPLDRSKKVIEEHRSLVKERPSALVKSSSEIAVSLIKNGERVICVKQFRYPYFRDRFKERFRRSKGLKSWIAGNGLRTRGIPAPEALAFVEIRDGLGLKESFFLMEASETGQEMDRYIFKGFVDLKEKRLFIQAFAQRLSHFHKMNLYHKDMKTCNILVSKNGETWDFYLLDMEDVLLNKEVNEKRLFKNFLQLNTSVPKSFTRTDRWRFFKEYTRIHPIVKNDKTFIHRLVEKSRERGVVYVSPEGVIQEKLF
jgi:tRNA A-37 threonylcarbamoyl transferase component Bud32